MSKLDNVKAFVKDNKTDILIGGGIVTGVVSAVTLIFSTIKAVEAYEEYKYAVSDLEDEKNDISEKTDEHEEQVAAIDNQIRKEKITYALNLTKLYAAPAIGGVVSVIAILAAHNIDKNEKNEALAVATEALAAASSISAAFAEYRRRVVDKYGEQADYDIYMGRSEVEVTSEEVDSKTGKKKTKKRIIVTTNPIDADIYKRVFSMWTSQECTKDPRKNHASLMAWKLAYQNQVDARGYAIANDFYQHAGFDTSVGPEQTEDFVPNRVGTISNKIWMFLPDEFDWKGRHYNKSEYSGTLDLGITPERLEQYDYDVMHGQTDDVWVLRPNFYPIDDILEYAHAYFRKKRKDDLAVDKMVLDNLGKSEFFNI